MAGIAKWSSPTVVTVLSTELNGVLYQTMSAPSGTISNNTDLNMYIDVEVNLASFSPTSGSHVFLYILEAIDGVNFPAASTTTYLPASQKFCELWTGLAAATPQRVVARNLRLPPGAFKMTLFNETGNSLAASGNTVKLSIYNIKGTG